jgi:hypothetical protein
MRALRWGMLVGSLFAGCIPAPQLRPRDGGGEREGVADGPTMDAAQDVTVETDGPRADIRERDDSDSREGGIAFDAGSIEDVGTQDVRVEPMDALADGGVDAAPSVDARSDGAAAPHDAPVDAQGCDGDLLADTGICAPETPPRLIGPISGSVSGSRRPMFRWLPGSPARPLTVTFCADRACARVLRSDPVGAGVAELRPSVDLPSGVLFWRVEMPTSAGRTLSSSTWELLISGRSGSPLTWMGLSDFDGDGTADVLAGAWGTSGNRGRAYGYPAGRIVSGIPSWTLEGAGVAGDYFGVSTAAIGDVNGDGFIDLAVGAVFEADQRGVVRVYHGSATGPSATPALSITGELREGQFGWSLAAAGDLNGDGYGDMLVGAPREGAEAGRVYAYFGGARGLRADSVRSLPGPGGAGGAFGFALAAIGDVDGDGLSDFVVGAPRFQTGRGEVYGFRGNRSTGFTEAPTIISAPSPGQFGFTFSALGDFDGNGSQDFAVGAPGADSGAGRVFIYSAGGAGFPTAPVGSITAPSAAPTSFGYALAGAMDMNGDEVPDLAVGAPLSALTVGAAAVFLGGRIPPSAPIRVLTSTAPALSLFGSAMSLPGDVDRDGLADLVIATPDAPMGGYFELFAGAVSTGLSSTPRVVRCPTTDGAHFASSLAR